MVATPGLRRIHLRWRPPAGNGADLHTTLHVWHRLYKAAPHPAFPPAPVVVRGRLGDARPRRAMERLAREAADAEAAAAAGGQGGRLMKQPRLHNQWVVQDTSLSRHDVVLPVNATDTTLQDLVNGDSYWVSLTFTNTRGQSESPILGPIIPIGAWHMTVGTPVATTALTAVCRCPSAACLLVIRSPHCASLSRSRGAGCPH